MSKCSKPVLYLLLSIFVELLKTSTESQVSTVTTGTGMYTCEVLYVMCIGIIPIKHQSYM